MTGGRRAWPVLLLACLLSAGAAVASTTSPILLPVNEDNLLILEVRAERYLASEALVGFRHEDQVLLPLGELAAALEYAIVSDPDQGVVEGWLVEEDRTFHLDVRARGVTVDGRQIGLNSPCLYVNDADVYATAGAIASWWPVDFEVDLRNMRVDVRAQEPVPLISRLQREQAWAQLEEKEDTRGTADYPRTASRYRLASWPFLDAAVSLQTGDDGSRYRGSLLSRGDLARLSMTGFLSFDSQLDRDAYAWLRAGRSDREAGLLGPLRATGFSLGDVTTTALPLLGGSVRGRGLSLTNRPVGSTSQFDTVDFHGDAPPGWEVELYVDGTLQDIQMASSEGYFRFDDIPLHIGLNTLRAVLYGPSGQKREQVRTYNIRSGMRQPGSLQYDIASVQAGRSLLGQDARSTLPNTPGAWHHQAEFRYGLGTATTMGAAFARGETDSTISHYVTGQVLHSLGPLFLQAAGAKDLDAGWAGTVGLQSRWGRRSVHLNYGRREDFRPPGSSGDRDVAQSLSARLNGSLGGRGRSAINYRLRVGREEYHGATDPRNAIGLYLGGNTGGINLSNEIQHVGGGGRSLARATTGNLFATGHAGGIRLSGQLAYHLDHEPDVDAAGATASYVFTPRLRGQMSGMYTLGAGSHGSWRGRLDWDLAPLRLGLEGGLTDDQWHVGLSATTSLTRAPRTGDWVLSSEKLTRRGAALVRTFIDRDADGAYGSGDDPLADVGFRGRRLWREIRTAEDGQAFLPGLMADRFENVEIDYGTVADPYLEPVHEGMTTVVHAGGVSELEFPFHYVGEVEGYVSQDQAMARPLRNIGLELVGPQGERHAGAVSEFDGYYLFQSVPPGTYDLRVVESTLRGRPLAVPGPAEVVVPPGGGFVSGPHLVMPLAEELERDSTPLPVAAAEQDAPSGEVVPGPDTPAASGADTRDVPSGAGQAMEVASRGEADGAAGRGVDGGEAGEADGSGDVRTPAATGQTPGQATTSRTPARTSAPTLSDRDTRVLHLIYEMLYQSQLFNGRSE